MVHGLAMLCIGWWFGERAPLDNAAERLHGELLIASTLGAIMIGLVVIIVATRRLGGMLFLTIPLGVVLALILGIPYGALFDAYYPDTGGQ